MKNLIISTAAALTALVALAAPASAEYVPNNEVRICNDSNYNLGDVYLKTEYNISVDYYSYFTDSKDLYSGWCRNYEVTTDYGANHIFFFHNLEEVVGTTLETGTEYVVKESDWGTLSVYYNN